MRARDLDARRRDCLKGRSSRTIKEVAARDSAERTAPIGSFLDAEPGVFAIYRYENVHAVFWTGTPTQAAARRLINILGAHTRESKLKLSAVHVIGSGWPGSLAGSVVSVVVPSFSYDFSIHPVLEMAQ